MRRSSVESDDSIMSCSSWELLDYEPSKIYIYEKKYRDYVVYFSMTGSSPCPNYRNFEHSSLGSTGIFVRNIRKTFK